MKPSLICRCRNCTISNTVITITNKALVVLKPQTLQKRRKVYIIYLKIQDRQKLQIHRIMVELAVRETAMQNDYIALRGQYVPKLPVFLGGGVTNLA
jgi:hypothetical protein